ncbi:hypothetical protein DWV97_02230 [Ruminococcus sp. AF14-10]|nr:hypothetical protein DWV97_02230 [Ruminococcus sp. AF14-10]
MIDEFLKIQRNGVLKRNRKKVLQGDRQSRCRSSLCLATALNPGMCQETLSEGGGNEPKSVIVFLKERCYNAFAFCDESVKKIA